MTKIESLYNDREVNIVTSWGSATAKITVNNTVARTSELAFLTAKGAYELVDWITENVKRPESPTALEQYKLLAPGTRLSRGANGAPEVIKITDNLVYSTRYSRVEELLPIWGEERLPLVVISTP